MTACDASPFLFELLLAISDKYGWTGFRLPVVPGTRSGAGRP